ncbi:MAG: hypothetical protein GY861_27055 [bacterium]|nr:hypothetical protein [bacterium]
MNKSEKLIDLVENRVITTIKNVDHDVGIEVFELYAKIRAVMLGLGTGRSPLHSEDIEEDDRWCSESPGIYKVFLDNGRNKAEMHTWVGNFVRMIKNSSSLDEINNFNAEYNLPAIPDGIATPRSGEFDVNV